MSGDAAMKEPPRPPHTECAICGASALTPWARAVDYEYGVDGAWDYLRCTQCGGVQMHPMPSEEALAGFYPATYGAYQAGNKPVKALMDIYLRREAARLARLIPRRTGRILDVGCGDGSALRNLARYGDWDLWGVEINEEAAGYARALGFNVQNGTLATADLPDGTFDLIRLGHVIEHLPAPEKALTRILSLLRPGGIVYGETPSTSCLDFHLLGKYWGALHAPRHLVLFNRDNLEDTLEAAGFVDVKTLACLPPVGWTVGVQNLLRDKLKLNLPRAGRYSWYLLLLPPFTVIAALQFLFGRTGIIAFRARKAAG
jgi:SAM-dependent methyltransferase